MIKVGDLVQVISGAEKGKKGKVIRVNREKQRAVVEKLNIRTKHIKKTREQAGQKIEVEGSIHLSNLMIICPETEKPTHIRYEISQDNKKTRVAVKSGANLDTSFVKS